MRREELARFKQVVWQTNAVRPVNIYAVLDCARNSSIHELIVRSYREKGCLFAGKVDPELERAAPFLLELQPRDSVTDEILLRGWEDAWGILIKTESSFARLRRHLRTFLRVRTEAGRFLLFRYYDPRTLDAYLPTCNQAELELLFDDHVESFIAFSASAGVTQRYTLQGKELQVEPLF